MSNKISINQKIVFEEDNLAMAAFSEKLNELIINNNLVNNHAIINFLNNINQDYIYYGGIDCELSQFFNDNVEDLKILLNLIDSIIDDFKCDILFYQRLAKKIKELRFSINEYLKSQF